MIIIKKGGMRGSSDRIVRFRKRRKFSLYILFWICSVFYYYYYYYHYNVIKTLLYLCMFMTNDNNNNNYKNENQQHKIYNNKVWIYPAFFFLLMYLKSPIDYIY